MRAGALSCLVFLTWSLAASGSAAQQAKRTRVATPKIVVVGDTSKARLVVLRLVAGDRRRGASRMRLHGRLHLPLRNSGREDLQVRIRYSAIGLDQLVTLPGPSATVSLAARRVSDEERLTALARAVAPMRGGMSEASTPRARAIVRVLRRVGRAPSVESSSQAARALVRELRPVLAAGRGVTNRTAAAVTARLRPLLAEADRAAPALRGRDLQPLLTTLAEGSSIRRIAIELGRFERRVAERRYPVIRAGELRLVDVDFKLPAGRPPADLAGTAVVEAFAGVAPRTEAQVAVPVEVSARPISGATFEPKMLVVQVTRYCLFFCGNQGGEDVRLVGPGSGDALADLSRAGAEGAAAFLRSQSGDRVLATLGPLEGNKDDPAIASAPLVLTPDPPPGTFTGELPLSRFASSSPALSLEARSRLWFPWAVLLIFTGVVVAGLLTHHIALSRRKDLIRRYLRHFVDEKYCSGVESNTLGESEKLLWPLEIECPLTDDPDWQYFQDLETPRSVYTAAKWARNDADLDEAENAARQQVLRITTWLLAVEQIRELHDLSMQDHRPFGNARWRERKTATQSRLLLIKAKRVPTDGEPAEKFLETVARQARWHHEFASAWELLLAAKEIDDEAAANVDLTLVDAKLKPVGERTDDDQDVLEEELAERVRDLEAIVDATRGASVLSPTPRSSEIRVLRAHVDSLQSPSPNRQHMLMQLKPAVATTADGPQAAATAELGAAPVRAGAKSLSERAGSVAMKTLAAANPPQLARRLKLRDTLLSFVVLGMTSLVYALTIYNASWGSATDLATAFVAGFAGHVVIKWGLLPAYRSIRLRAQTAVETAEPVAAAAAVVASGRTA